MPNKNGGPAFPGEYVKHESGEVGNNVPIMAMSSGMTLRDYFAAQALSTAMSVPWRDVGYTPANGLTDFEQHARLAYQMADAMLAERSK